MAGKVFLRGYETLLAPPGFQSASSLYDDKSYLSLIPGASPSSIYSSLTPQILALSKRIFASQRAKEDMIDWRAYGYAKSTSRVFNFKIRRTLYYEGRTSAMCWRADGCTLASASYKGFVILWNALMETKSVVIYLPWEWPLTVDVEPLEDEHLVVAGASCSGRVYKMAQLYASMEDRKMKDVEPSVTLEGEDGHKNFISSARFLTPHRVATASGDGTVKVWDISLGHCIYTLGSIESGIISSPIYSLSRHPMDPDMLTTGSGDGIVRMWDLRIGRRDYPVLTLSGFLGPVTAVNYFPSAMALAASSEDSTVRVFDVRSCGALGVYGDEAMPCAATDVVFSKSGTLLFASYENGYVVCWEPLSADGYLHDLVGHGTEAVSCLALNPEGQALASAGHDKKICIWA